jgi:hypothetical protein
MVIASLEMLGFSNIQAGVVGQSFILQLPAAGGVPPYTWTFISGELPPGLSLTSNGRLVGTPTKAGTFSYHLRLTDAKETYVEGDYTQKIVEGGTINFIVSWSQTLSYNENQVVVYVPLVQGGKLPWIFTIDGLPDGLTYDPETGLISGTTTTKADVRMITIKAKDADGKEALVSPLTVILMINPPKPSFIAGQKSPYEGTYNGIFSYEYEEYATESKPAKTVAGGFRISITLSNPIITGSVTVLQITHASCSDPFFGCQVGGCTPNFPSVATLPSDPPTGPMHESEAGMGFAIFFPNGATLATTNSPGSLNVGYDGRMISNSLDPAIQNNTWVAASLTGGQTFLPQASSIKFKSWSLSWSYALN